MKVILSLMLLIMMISVSGCAIETPKASPVESITPASTPESAMPAGSNGALPQSYSSPEALLAAEPMSLSEIAAAADLIALGSITNLEYKVLPMTIRLVGATEETKQVHTIYTLAVEKVIKGDPDIKEVLIKKLGGRDPDGRYILDVEDEHYFGLGATMLVALHVQNDGTYVAWSRDELWYKGETFVPRHNSDIAIGRLFAAMESDNIPVTLPRSDWPPIPVGPITRPAN